MTFDLPQPLGPTMPTSPPGVAIVVGSTNDLNPASLIWVRRKDVKWEVSRRKTGGSPHDATPGLH